jgi:MFS transporter, DHA2 family, multidrug resistance protein
MDESKTLSTGQPPAAGGRWLIAIAVMFGAFISVMDVSVVNVALPHMMGNFGQDLSSITWVSTAYSIAEIITITMTGWLSTLIGRKRLYLSSFVLFTSASILCGTSRSFAEMLVFRALQGMGGGSLIPVSQAILRETFPPKEQGMAMAAFGVGVVIAPALGPVFGGWLTDHYGWPWIFFINVPFAALGILMVGLFVMDPPYLRRGMLRIDWISILSLAISLTTLQLVLERGEANDWFSSPWITAGAVTCVISFMFLLFWDLHSQEPVVNFRLLRDIPLSVGSGIGLIFGLTLYGTTFSIPALLQNLLGYTAYEAGLVLLPRGIGILLLLPIVGWLYNHLQPRVLVIAGIGLIFIAYQQIAYLSTNVSFDSLLLPLLIMGMGMPFLFVTLTTLSLATIKREHMTTASGLYTLGRRVGGNIGYAVVATLVDRRMQLHHAQLIANVSTRNPTFQKYYSILLDSMTRRGFGLVTAQKKALAVIHRMVNQQATMMAYNDVSLLFGMMFLAVLPFVFLLPKRKPDHAPMESVES